MNRWKPALKAFAIDYPDRLDQAATEAEHGVVPHH
jgi:hypothetical protein